MSITEERYLKISFRVKGQLVFYIHMRTDIAQKVWSAFLKAWKDC